MSSDMLSEPYAAKERYLHTAARQAEGPYIDNEPRHTQHFHSEPREDHLYRFLAETKTTPSTAVEKGVHRIVDEQRITETLVYSGHDVQKVTERTAVVKQTMESSKVHFNLRVRVETSTPGQEPSVQFDEVFDFGYDMAYAMSHISGWMDELSAPTMMPGPSRPLTSMTSPTAQFASRRTPAQATSRTDPRLKPATSTALPLTRFKKLEDSDDEQPIRSASSRGAATNPSRRFSLPPFEEISEA